MALRVLSDGRDWKRKVEIIAAAYKFPDVFDLPRRLADAVVDYRAHSKLGRKGAAAALTRKQSLLLRTLGRRAVARRPARMRETLKGLGFEGQVELGIHGWSGSLDDGSLVDSINRALLNRVRFPLNHRLRRAELWWVHALVCIYALGHGALPPVTRRADGVAGGCLADFLQECSEVAAITPGRIAESTLRVMMAEPSVKLSIEKGKRSIAS